MFKPLNELNIVLLDDRAVSCKCQHSNNKCYIEFETTRRGIQLIPIVEFVEIKDVDRKVGVESNRTTTNMIILCTLNLFFMCK